MFTKWLTAREMQITIMINRSFLRVNVIKKTLFIALALILLSVTALALLEESVDADVLATIPTPPVVSTLLVKPEAHRGMIEALAKVEPRWNVSVRTRVKGNVIAASEYPLAGMHVNQGDTLYNIENSFYLAQVHEAQQQLASAKIHVEQERKKAERAMDNWRRTDINRQPSDLALNKPQLELAKRTLQTAESHLKAAHQNLQYTHIKAPFSGFVTQRYVSPGKTVDEGDVMLDMIGSGQHDIRVWLSEKQWALLDKEWHSDAVTLHHESGQLLGTATIARGGDFLDPVTHLYPLFITISNANNKVLSGSFVRLRLPGRVSNDSVKVPVGSLTRDGYIWQVTKQDRLKRIKTEALFYLGDWAIIPNPTLDTDPWRVAVTPLASFLSGSKVEPNAIDLKHYALLPPKGLP